MSDFRAMSDFRDVCGYVCYKLAPLQPPVRTGRKKEGVGAVVSVCVCVCV